MIDENGMKIDYELIYTVDCDGSTYTLTEPVFVELRPQDHVLFVQTKSGEKLNFMWKQHFLSGWKKLMYKYLNKMGIFSSLPNKIIFLQLKDRGLIK